MADPISAMAIGGMGMSAGGSILGAFGKGTEDASKGAMYGYQSGMAELRRKIALQNRDYSLQTGEDQAFRYGLKAKQEMGKIAVHQGASRIDVSSGSSADVRASQKYVTDLDAATIRNNAARKAYGYEVEAMKEGAQRDIYSFAQQGTKDAAFFDVAGSLLGGASSVSDKWMQARSAGVPAFV